MKLKNRISVANKMSPLLIAYCYLGTLIVGTIALVYFNTNSSTSYATDHPTNGPTKNTLSVSGKDFRILQNGAPIHPVMGVAVNSSAIFDIQIKNGIDLKKVKTKPLAAEVSIVRGDKKVNSMKFENVAEMKNKNLQDWIKEQFQPGDKLSIELQNTLLSPTDAVKVYSLAMAY
jgi:hypothetical protein